MGYYYLLELLVFHVFYLFVQIVYIMPIVAMIVKVGMALLPHQDLVNFVHLRLHFVKFAILQIFYNVLFKKKKKYLMQVFVKFVLLDVVHVIT